MKLCLYLSYTLQNSFQFDEIFENFNVFDLTDWDLRPIQKTEPISKFGFSDYALVNMEDEEQVPGGQDVKVTLPDGTYTVLQLPSKDISAQALIEKVMSRHKIRQKSGVNYTFLLEPKSQAGKPMDAQQSITSVDDSEFFIVRQNSRRCAEFQASDNMSNLGFYPIGNVQLFFSS